MITYQEETISDCKEELWPLIQLHHEEIDFYQDKVELDPDWDQFLALESLGITKMMTVRDSGKLVGYFMSLVMPHPHYKSDLYAINDILLLHPDYRKAGVAVELFTRFEAWMKELGVSVMTVNMKTTAPFDALCEGLGWDYTERQYSKCIKD